MCIAADPLICALLERDGDNTWLRQFARLRRCAWMLDSLSVTLAQLRQVMGEPHHVDPGSRPGPTARATADRSGSRRTGPLGGIRDGVIDKYQIVTPTAWNATPRDSEGRHGHWERSIIGMRVDNPDNPVAIGHVVRSHDPCLVCTRAFHRPRWKDENRCLTCARPVFCVSGTRFTAMMASVMRFFALLERSTIRTSRSTTARSGVRCPALFADCAHVVVVDAMAGPCPGTLRVLAADEVPVEDSGSSHGAGVGALLAAVRAALGEMPRIDVIAVEIAVLFRSRPD